MIEIPSATAVYGGNYLTAFIVKNEKLVGKALKITEVAEQEFAKDDKPAQTKIVLSLDGISKKLVLNRVNASILIEAYGDDYEEWVGKSLRLNVMKVQFGRDIVDGISVSVDTPASSFKQGVLG